MRIKDSSAITPIEIYNNMYFKRDDYYLPFDDLNKLGGSKVRQMVMLFEELKETWHDGVAGLITYSSVNSPQSIIVARICYEQKVPCIICIGGADNDINKVINNHSTLKLSKKYGAEIQSVSRLGYNNVLKSRAEEIASTNGFTLVHFGINLENYKNALIGSIANQVKNLPDELDNLIIPCGSGITTAGIIVGLKLFNKKVKRVIPIQISGYDRKNEINKILSLYDIDADYDFRIDKTYQYPEQVIQFIKPGLQLNVIYEAKAYKYLLRNQKGLGIEKEDKTLFYIIADNNFLFQK